MAAVKMVVGGARDASIPASVWGMNEDGSVEWTYDTAGTVNFIKREPSSGNYYIGGNAADNGDGNGTRSVWILDSSGNYINGAYVGSSSVQALDMDSNYAYFGTSSGAYRTDLDLSNEQTIVGSSSRRAIAVDSSGNIYVGGGGIPATLTKYNSSFVSQWTEDTNDQLYSIDFLSDGTVIVGTSDGEVRRYESDGSSPSAGTWAVVVDGTSSIFIKAIVDSNDIIYACRFNEASGSNKRFVALNTSGVEQWSVTTPGGDLEQLVLDSNEDLWLVGDYAYNHNIFKADVSEEAVYGMMYDTNRSTTITAIDIDPTFSYSGELGDNLEGFWKMNDNDASTNVDDSSDNNRDGTASRNTSLMTTTGQVNEALEFDYNNPDDVDVGDISVFDLGPNEPKTIAFWLNWSGDGGLLPTIIHKYEGGVVTTGWAIFITKSSNRINFQSYNGTTLSQSVDLDNVSGTPTNDWHLFIARIDREGRLTVSLDNREDVSSVDISSDSAVDFSNAESMFLGGNAAVNANYSGFDGALDVVGFWSRILTEEEEAQIWNSGSGTEDFGLVDPPVITDQSTDTDANFGDNVTFSVTVSGTSPFTYQWYKDGNAIVGETSSSITLSSVDADDGADYTCTVTNAAGSDTTTPITLRIIPYITAQTNSTDVARNSEFSLSITGNGSPSPTYQWYKGGVSIAGETSATLTKFWTDSDAGTYTCTLTNGAGSVTSSDIVITIVDNPYVYDLFNLPFDLERETN